MLDLKLIRENPELVKQGIKNKNEADRLDELIKLDEQRRELILKAEELKFKRNQVSSQIPQMKKAGQDVSNILSEMKIVSDLISDMDSQLKTVEAKVEDILLYIPNLPHESVPVGKSAADNVEVKQWLPDGFSFDNKENILDHIELGKKLKILDFERGAKISGSGFPLYTGKGATLERSLINFMLDFHLQNHGYSEVFPPFLVNKESMRGTGQLAQNG